MYYAQAHICERNAEEALNNLMVMFEPQFIAGSFYCKEIFQRVPTLEAAFEKLYIWDRRSTCVHQVLYDIQALNLKSVKAIVPLKGIGHGTISS